MKAVSEIFDNQKGECPIDNALCCFHNNKSIFVLGYMTDTGAIKQYGKKRYLDGSAFTHYFYILNPDGGFYWT